MKRRPWAAGGGGVGGEDAGGETGRVGGGQDLAQGVLERGKRMAPAVAVRDRMLGEVGRAFTG